MENTMKIARIPTILSCYTHFFNIDIDNLSFAFVPAPEILIVPVGNVFIIPWLSLHAWGLIKPCLLVNCCFCVKIDLSQIFYWAIIHGLLPWIENINIVFIDIVAKQDEGSPVLMEFMDLIWSSLCSVARKIYTYIQAYHTETNTY